MKFPAVLLSGVLVIGAINLAITAQPSVSQPSVSQPSVSTETAAPATDLFPILDGIQLTPAQQTQINTIMDQARTELQTILTPEQQNRFWSTLSQSQSFRDAVMEMNVTVAQRRQIALAFTSAGTQMRDVLTPDQRGQIRNNARSQWGFQ